MKRERIEKRKKNDGKMKEEKNSGKELGKIK